MLLTYFASFRRLSLSCVGALLVAAAPVLHAADDAYSFSHFAGSIGGAGAIDGTGSAARFYRPGGVSIDGSGNIFVADTQNHTIRKVTPAGVVTTFAGSAGISGNTDGTGSEARFDSPGRMAFDAAGNLYVPDSHSHVIRKITPGGVVTTFAGTAGTSGSTDATGAAARFNSPAAVAVDASGNVYVADSGNDAIRKITPAGVVTTFAGTAGVTGSADGTGAAAHFFSPDGLAVDAAGNVYVCDTANQTIRKITPARVVTTLAGTVGVAGNADGTGTQASFSLPEGIAVDGSGNLYVAEGTTIRKVTSAGVVTTVAGSAGANGSVDGLGTAARFTNAIAIAAAADGTLAVADEGTSLIRQIAPDRTVSTLAGSIGAAGSTDATGVLARFSYPYGLAVDAAGNVYVGEVNNHTIRKITPAGVVTTLAGSAGLSGSADGTGAAARFNAPFGLAADAAGNVYVADYWNATIRKITPAGVVTTIAGSAGHSGDVDGAGSAARFSGLTGLAIDGAGNLYATSSSSHTIRKITPAGVVSTFAGTAGQSGDVNGVGAAARFSYPYGIACDDDGNLYVTEASGVVRKVTPAGAVTTLAGTAGQTGSADGTGAAARFGGPIGVTVDGSGNVYVADSFNHTIRKISAGGEVTTIGGVSGHYGATDGTGSAALFDFPCGIAIDASGDLYIADSANNAIRKGGSGVNTPPTITAIADLSVAAGTTSAALTFTVHDAQSPAAQLNVTASSSDSTLLPVSAIALGGGGALRTVRLSPRAGGSGSATVTLTVSDGVLSAQRSFKLTVTANTAPTISPIGDQLIAKNGKSGAIKFQIGDPDTALVHLMVSARSSNTALIPNSRIVLAGTGANRSLTITPIAGKTGRARITVKVSDGHQAAVTSFIVTVQLMPPTISAIGDLVIPENGKSGAIKFQIGDPDTALVHLMVSAVSSNATLIPNSGIVLAGTGANRSLTITPAAKKTGKATITVKVSDGHHAATASFDVTVQMMPPTISAIGDQVISESGKSGAIKFQIADADTAIVHLSVSAMSSNTTLIPGSGLVLSGTGGNRSLTITPAVAKTGHATITVKVSDGHHAAVTSFDVTVQATAPTISAIEDRVIPQNGESGAIVFQIADPDTAFVHLTVSARSSDSSLIPASALVLEGTGANRSLTITPVADATGEATITVKVSDGHHAAVTRFVATVEA